MDAKYTLAQLRPGERAEVRALGCRNEMTQRLMQLGFIPGTQVICVGSGPWGDPRAYLVRGAVIALRGTDAALVETSPALPVEGGGELG